VADPAAADSPRIRFAMLKGNVRVVADFDDPLRETVIARFEGR
jgi:hypothetical protein